MTLFQKIEAEQKKAEMRGEMGPMPNDAIAFLRYKNIKELCDTLETKSVEAGITPQQAVSKLPWHMMEAAFPYSTPAHDLIKRLA